MVIFIGSPDELRKGRMHTFNALEYNNEKKKNYIKLKLQQGSQLKNLYIYLLGIEPNIVILTQKYPTKYQCAITYHDRKSFSYKYTTTYRVDDGVIYIWQRQFQNKSRK